MNPRTEGALGCSLADENKPARHAPRNSKLNCTSSPPFAGGGGVFPKHKRLSATDIPALASMKNVAKCDTWCELQNPVNHRVFERKLRPKPVGRGHVCLGVTHFVGPSLCTPCRAARFGGRILASRALLRGWHKSESPAIGVATFGGCKDLLLMSCGYPSSVPATLWCHPRCALRLRPQVRRDYPLSLSISISGGKETYKDSPSNGERTGNSPA